MRPTRIEPGAEATILTITPRRLLHCNNFVKPLGHWNKADLKQFDSAQKNSNPTKLKWKIYLVLLIWFSGKACTVPEFKTHISPHGQLGRKQQNPDGGERESHKARDVWNDKHTTLRDHSQ